MLATFPAKLGKYPEAEERDGTVYVDAKNVCREKDSA
jgi:hypothetical protein